jgi:hypothetical protein
MSKLSETPLDEIATSIIYGIGFNCCTLGLAFESWFSMALG